MSLLDLFRPKAAQKVDRLEEADLTTNMVLGLFEDAIEDLDYVTDLTSAEQEDAEATIKAAQARQRLAKQQAERAERVATRLRELVS